MAGSRILLVENIHGVAKETLQAEGFQVDLIAHSPSEEELLQLLPKYDAIGIRSKTQITEKVLAANPQLVTIGCFCIGTNQVDLEAAKKGEFLFLMHPIRTLDLLQSLLLQK